MLLSTFQHLKGISAKKELELWHSGKICWEDFEKAQSKQLPLFDNSNGSENSSLYLSKKALLEENVDFFAKSLSNNEYFRIALNFPDKTMFLDIETTGLSKYYDEITLIGWSFGEEYGVFINGGKEKTFLQAISRAKVIVTFNGSIFDLPFIRKKYPNLSIPLCHIDLRFLSRRVGLSGGQKTIEKTLGIKRPENLSDIKGETAALLWFQYRWGDPEALRQLISYNHADVEGMKIIFDSVVERLLDKYKVPPRARRVFHFAKHKSKINWDTKELTSGEGIKIRPYHGQPGPLITLKDLAVLSDKSIFRVVGIDLTGSEARPSGWCLLNNDFAETKRLGSDDEIINETLEAKPNIISIDSPLSIPEGRTTVSDDDPGRNLYGIMRYCERILKKRGVNVYPCLIPSMQKLTARGIRLANQFRSLGIPVIESYPGAAQDIMGIPRKRASLELLARGLQLFGIKGDFTRNNVTHDELDAITSAVVGLFFWSGRYEALGNEEEEYLTIPDLKIDPTKSIKRKVIGLSGPIAAGKTTAGKFLESQGFHYGRFSQVLESLLNEKGIKSNRQNLQKIGEEVNKNQGQRWLCKKLLQMLPNQGDMVIDGLRHPEDHAFMVETFGSAFLHLYIDSPEDVRMERYVTNNMGKKREFLKAVKHSVEAKVLKLYSLAHIVVKNVATISAFKSRVKKIINKDRTTEQTTKGESAACL
jgi:uncharacterized protein YprB with RNaseH-like and TPR domain/predicted nuclease with RNAse H fold/dephospho-CoA kinase